MNGLLLFVPLAVLLWLVVWCLLLNQCHHGDPD